MVGGRGRAVAAVPKLIKSLRQTQMQRPNVPSYEKQSHLPSLGRAFSLYEQIKQVEAIPKNQLRFQSYSDTGFTANDVEYEGSLLCIGNLVMSWSPTKFSEITPESLSIFRIVRPIPEILVIGCGRNIAPLDPELRRCIKSMGMKVEAIDSRNAVHTYNLLHGDCRNAAAALIPYGVPS